MHVMHKRYVALYVHHKVLTDKPIGHYTLLSIKYQTSNVLIDTAVTKLKLQNFKAHQDTTVVMNRQSLTLNTIKTQLSH